MFHPDDRGAMPPQATDGAGHVRVVDDQVVRKPSGDEQAVVRAVGHVLDALVVGDVGVDKYRTCRGTRVGRDGEKRCNRIGRRLVALTISGD